MSRDSERTHEDLAQPQRRQLMMAIAAIAGLALTTRLPALLNAGGDPDPLAQLLKALGYDAGESVALTNAEVELHLGRILRAPLAVLSSDPSAQELRQRIRRNIEADYRAGDIRVIDGWWLSATEANCLALIEQVRAG
jgi:hypothetical protein